MKRSIFALLFGMAILSNGYLNGQEARLLRFPTIHDNQIVFSYAGDLYTVSSMGGTARKLTSHNGYEVFPRFSPDGKYVAFTGQYDGNTEVFHIPAEGGEPGPSDRSSRRQCPAMPLRRAHGMADAMRSAAVRQKVLTNA